MNKNRLRQALSGGLLVAAAAGLIAGTAATSAAAAAAPSSGPQSAAVQAAAYPVHKPVEIEVFAPEAGDNAGIQGKGWFVDMEISFPGGPGSLHRTGFTGLQLTGPGVHTNVAPAPGLFGTGKDDRNPGLVVLTTTTTSALPGFHGPGTNLAGLFNITGVTNRSAHETELWDTWLVGAPVAGVNVNTKLIVAEIADRNHNGIYDDAPNQVGDYNHDRRIDAKDVALLGVASNIVVVPFHVNGAPA